MRQRVIGPANSALYRSINNAAHWRNPFIVVYSDGVDVRAGRVKQPTRIPIAELKAFLIGLPVSAWPYGRVVAQGDSGVVPAPGDALRGYDKRMKANRARIAAVLKELAVRPEMWPSA